jgi:hypothetical protein
VPGEGLEPTRIAPEDFKSSASASSATPALLHITALRHELQLSRLACGECALALHTLSGKMSMARNKRIIALISVMLGTALSGIAMAAVIAFVLSRVMSNSFGGWGGLLAAGIGIAAGYPAGIIIAQVVVKRAMHYPGSLLGGAAGVMVGVLPLVVGEIWPLSLPAGGAAILLLVLCPLLGTAGFHLGKH